MDQQPTYTYENYPGRGLAIAGLVLGIISVMMAFIPCIGALALVPGVAGVVLSAIAFAKIQKAKAPNGIVISGLVCSILACCIALIQIWVLQKAGEEFKEHGGFDTLSIRMKTLEVAVDSLWNKEMESK
jgi:uncharacterized membrane protein